MKNLNKSYDAGLMLAPVTITPTKPLTPTHVKGLLWLDVMYRSTRQVVRTDLMWNPRAAHLTTQSTAFWAFLDRHLPGTRWEELSEQELGEIYVRSHTETRPTVAELLPYLRRVDEEGWIHPASIRLLQLWRRQLALLNVEDPGLLRDRPLTMSADEAVALLADQDLLIDHRRFGGPVYVDGPRWGLPLRQLAGPDGLVNYLLPILRDLLPHAARGDRILLVHDAELTQDYVLLDRILTVAGGEVTRLSLGRVPIDGVIVSSRHGGWQGATLERLSATCLEQVDLPTYRLGMRLYFVGALKRSSPQSFDPELLRRSLQRAAKVIDRVGADGDPCDDFLRDLLGKPGYVDPYRLTTSLTARHRTVPVADLLNRVYL